MQSSPKPTSWATLPLCPQTYLHCMRIRHISGNGKGKNDVVSACSTQAFNPWWKSASRLRPIERICSHVLVSYSHTFCNQAKELWEEVRWKISTALHYSETWQETRLKRKGEKLIISAHSLWTWPNETQATQSKKVPKKSSLKITQNTDAVWNPIPLGAKGTLRESKLSVLYKTTYIEMYAICHTHISKWSHVPWLQFYTV